MSGGQEVQFPFRRDGFCHELLEQTARVSLVKRSKAGRQLHYEVALLQQHGAKQWPDGRFTPAGWHYPSSERWGETGWTYTDLAEARHPYLSEAQKQGVKAAGSTIQRARTSNALNRILSIREARYK